jgi:hypothetical protein
MPISLPIIPTFSRPGWVATCCTERRVPALFGVLSVIAGLTACGGGGQDYPGGADVFVDAGAVVAPNSFAGLQMRSVADCPRLVPSAHASASICDADGQAQGMAAPPYGQQQILSVANQTPSDQPQLGDVSSNEGSFSEEQSLAVYAAEAAATVSTSTSLDSEPSFQSSSAVRQETAAVSVEGSGM